MAGPWVTDASMLQVLADRLKLASVNDLEPQWSRVVTDCIQTAYSDIRSILMGRGYTMAQLDAWDDRVTYNRQQALFWLYTESSLGIGYDDKEINKMDRRDWLKEETIMINGEAVAPGATGSASTLGAGAISEDGYRVTGETTW